MDPGPLDGVYGMDTHDAFCAWKQRNGAPPCDSVSVDDWRAITGEAAPCAQQRIIQLVADFDRRSFGRLHGNINGDWLTWGIIGFTLRRGEIQHIINEVHVKHPHVLRAAFGSLEDEILAMVNASSAEQQAFSHAISLGRQGDRVEHRWSAAFDRLGDCAEVQQVQLERIGKFWAIALRDARRFALNTELGLALCFEIALQNGGIDTRLEEPAILRRLEKQPPKQEADKRGTIASVVTENSSSHRWSENQGRQATLARGKGSVRGHRYVLSDWGIDDSPFHQSVVD